jgi:glycosyltransferase involved in cell wall biosynthesis
MKILYFYQYFGTPKGRWSTRVYENVRRWIDEGHQVTVLTCPYYKSDIKAHGFISRQEVEGIKLIVVNTPDSNLFNIPRRMFNAVAFAIISMWYALYLKYEVAISSSGPMSTGLALFPAKWIRNKTTIFEVRDLWPAGGIEMGLIKNEWMKSLTLWFEKSVYKVSNLVVTSSVGQEAHIKMRFPWLHTLVIPNSSDVEFFSQPLIDQVELIELEKQITSKPFVSYIGSLGFIHNCGFILEVAEKCQGEFRKRNLQIVFIGDGSEKELLEKKKENLSLEFVHFLGSKPKNELPFWFQNSLCTLFTTLDNPVQNTSSPNKIFDSFAAKTPIVQNTTGWIMDLVQNEHCGLNSRPGDAVAFGQSIFTICDNLAIRDKLSDGAVRVANELFDRNSLANRFLEGIMKVKQ